MSNKDYPDEKETVIEKEINKSYYFTILSDLLKLP